MSLVTFDIAADILGILITIVVTIRALLIVSVGICAGFATFENCCYILSSGADSLSYVLVRGLAVSVMHVVSGLAVAFGLVLARRYKMLTLAGVTGALGLYTTFHALYNLLVSEPGIASTIGYILPLVSAAMLYLPYRRIIAGEDK